LVLQEANLDYNSWDHLSHITDPLYDQKQAERSHPCSSSIPTAELSRRIINWVPLSSKKHIRISSFSHHSNKICKTPSLSTCLQVTTSTLFRETPRFRCWSPNLSDHFSISSWMFQVLPSAERQDARRMEPAQEYCFFVTGSPWLVIFYWCHECI